MKHFALAALAGAALVLGSHAAYAAPVVDVLPGITGHDRDWMNMAIAFDAQPTWDGTQPVSASTTELDTIGAYAGRYAYIDFGPNYASMNITQAWTRYKNWSANDVRVFADMGWATSYDGWNIPALIPETQLKLASQAALPYHNDATWVQDVDLTATPVVPQGQYLFLHAMTPQNDNQRVAEFAFVGYVPEPTSLGILGFIGVGAMLRRRKA